MPPEVQALLDAIRQGQGVDDAVKNVPTEHLETAVTQTGAILLSAQETDANRRQASIAITKLVDRPDAADNVKTAVAPILGQIYLNPNEQDAIRNIGQGVLENKLNAVDTILIFQKAVRQASPANQQAPLRSLEKLIVRLFDEQKRDSGNEQKYYDVIQQISPENLDQILTKALTTPDIGDGPAAAAVALGKIGNDQARTFLCDFLAADLQTQEAETEQAILNENTVTIRINVCTALGEIGDVAAIPCLGETLRRHPHYRVRRIAASALNKLQNTSSIDYLVKACLLDQNHEVRKVAKDSLIRQADWQEKTNRIINLLANNPGQTLFADNSAILQIMKPSGADTERNTPYQLTDYLIDLTVSQHLRNEQLVARLADFIVISANGSKKIAGERIAFYRDRDDTAVTNETLQPLQIEIGGVTALNPILSQLEKNLETYFQLPIKELNDNTRDVWRQTIFIAHTGFTLRALMSVALFLLGGYLVFDSYQQFKTGQLDMIGFFGAGIPFVSGLATMLMMIFTGPLKQIRQAVSDVGIANTAFISYIHRVSQVSHTFSYYYLQGKISFAELANASQLIEDTTEDTINILKNSATEQEPDAPAG